MENYCITFQPDGISIKVSPDITINQAAYRAGVILNNHCGSAGTCKKCWVEIADEHRMVLACQYRINRNIIINVPDTSRFYEQKILEQDFTKPGETDPMIRKFKLSVPPPGIEDLRSDAQRLLDAIHEKNKSEDVSGKNESEYTINEQLITTLSNKLRQSEFAVTAVCHKNEIFELQQGDTTDSIFGVSVDIGTTTVVAHLIDLVQGTTIATASKTNPQISCGDDVISRIQFADTQTDGLKHLQAIIVDCINELIDQLCQESSQSKHNIFELTAAGNSTMQHLFMGAPVAQIAQAPYVTSFSGPINQPASALSLNIHPNANIYIFPGVAAHVGGDTVAVTLATAMSQSEYINLALDIGTNGEIILGNRLRLLACSTAAGPALEGARIKHGMRAAPGAIERVCLTNEVNLSIIGETKSTGICGSGLIDAVAELLEQNIIDKTGRMISKDNLPSNLPENLRQRVTEIDGKPAFILAPADLSSTGVDIVLTQKDIREVQLVKAAIRAGMDILLQQLNIKWPEIDRFYLAGAFGNFIQPQSAQKIGLLPDIPLSKIQPVGNAAAAGIRNALLSRNARHTAEKIARKIEYIELAAHPEFQNLFSNHMLFPHP
ncbi:MAG: DUF4445 domain-containing protein [Planctomycetes bacterium]|nr:DUF4445 domain-containing protein [Planctomycetota bacterium]